MGEIVSRARYQRVAPKDKNYYVQRSVKYSTISFDEICNNVAESIGVSRAVARSSVSAIVKQMKQMLLNGHTLKVGNAFYLRYSMTCKAKGRAKDLTANDIQRQRILVKPTDRVAKALQNINYTVVVGQEAI